MRYWTRLVVLSLCTGSTAYATGSGGTGATDTAWAGDTTAADTAMITDTTWDTAGSLSSTGDTGTVPSTPTDTAPGGVSTTDTSAATPTTPTTPTNPCDTSDTGTCWPWDTGGWFGPSYTAADLAGEKGGCERDGCATSHGSLLLWPVGMLVVFGLRRRA